MKPAKTPTGYARLSPFAARAVLLLLAVATGLLVLVTVSPLASGRVGQPARGEGDVALYRAEVQRTRQGEGYYQAVATELRERGYPKCFVNINFWGCGFRGVSFQLAFDAKLQ